MSTYSKMYSYWELNNTNTRSIITVYCTKDRRWEAGGLYKTLLGVLGRAGGVDGVLFVCDVKCDDGVLFICVVGTVVGVF